MMAQSYAATPVPGPACEANQSSQSCDPFAGMNGESSLREVSLATGEVRRKKMLEHADFAEGVTKFGGR